MPVSGEYHAPRFTAPWRSRAHLRHRACEAQRVIPSAAVERESRIVNIRRATEADYEGVCAVFAEGDAYHRVNAPGIHRVPDRPARGRDYYADILTNAAQALFVAEVDGTIAGAVAVCPGDGVDESTLSAVRHDRVTNSSSWKLVCADYSLETSICATASESAASLASPASPEGCLPEHAPSASERSSNERAAVRRVDGDLELFVGSVERASSAT